MEIAFHRRQYGNTPRFLLQRIETISRSASPSFLRTRPCLFLQTWPGQGRRLNMDFLHSRHTTTQTVQSPDICGSHLSPSPTMSEYTHYPLCSLKILAFDPLPVKRYDSSSGQALNCFNPAMVKPYLDSVLLEAAHALQKGSPETGSDMHSPSTQQVGIFVQGRGVDYNKIQTTRNNTDHHHHKGDSI
jgi:hypothetical protein